MKLFVVYTVYKIYIYTMKTKKQLPRKSEIIERLEKITNSVISSDLLFKPNGKNWTVLFYNCSVGKHFKATVKYGFLISNIRETKDRV